MQSTQAGSITFMVNPEYRKHLGVCQTPAIVMTQDDLPFAKSTTLVVKNPYLVYTHMVQTLDTTPQPTRDIVPSAVVNATVKLDSNISTGADTVIESDVELGDNVVTGAGCFVGKNTKINAGSHPWVNVTIYHGIQTGGNCLIQSSTVVGSDRFGYANDRGDWVKTPRLGRIITDDRVRIGARTTIDRNALDNTMVGNGVTVNNQCQIAHGVVIGDNTAATGGVIVAGSLKIGRYYMADSAGMINGYIEIYDKIAVTGMGMVIRPVTEPGVYSSDIPLQPSRIWHKTAAPVMNIDDTNKRLKAIERKVNQQN